MNFQATDENAKVSKRWKIVSGIRKLTGEYTLVDGTTKRMEGTCRQIDGLRVDAGGALLSNLFSDVNIPQISK